MPQAHAIALAAPAPLPAPSTTPPPKHRPPQPLEATVWLPADRTSRIAGTSIGASANMGHRVAARCTRWGRSLAGEIVLTVELTITSPPGTLPALGEGGRR